MGKRNISIENIAKISNGLEISLQELFDFSRPIKKTIVLKINGATFILETDQELTPDLKGDIEAICDYFFDEDNSWYDEDLEDMSVYKLASLFQEVIKEETGLTLTFKAIDLEVRIENEY